MTNNLKILKKNWVKFKFSEIAENIVEKITPKKSKINYYVGLKNLSAESIHVTNFSNPSNLKGDKLVGYKNDVILGKRNAYLKRAAILDRQVIASAHSFILRARKDVIIPELFIFFLNSETFWDTAIKISVGSLSPTINWKSLAKQEFLLPPLEEQKKLADLLWAGDELSQRYRKLEKVLDEYRQSYFKSMVINKDKNSSLGKLYNLRVEKSIAPHQLRSYLGMDGVESGKFFISKMIDSKNVKSVSSMFYKDDVLYGKLRPNLDKAIISNKNGIASTEFLVLKPRKGHKWFLIQYLHSKQFISYASSRSYGTKMPRVSSEIISKFKIHLPDDNQLNVIEKKIEDIFNISATLSVVKNQHLTLYKTLINEIFE